MKMKILLKASWLLSIVLLFFFVEIDDTDHSCHGEPSMLLVSLMFMVMCGMGVQVGRWIKDVWRYWRHTRHFDYLDHINTIN